MVSHAITRIIDTARIHAPGALDGVLRIELFNTVKDFFNHTDAWQERLPIFVESGVHHYELVSGDRGFINRLMSLVYLSAMPDAGTAATYLPAGNFGAGFGGDFSNTSLVLASTGNTAHAVGDSQLISPRKGMLTRSGAEGAILRITDAPATGELWRATFSLVVADPVDEDGLPYMPMWAIEKYHEVIQDGLLSRVMMHPAKPYSNQQLAAFHGRKYLQGVGTAKREVLTGSTFGAQRWQYPQQFRTRSQRFIR